MTQAYFDRSGQLRRPSYGRLFAEAAALLFDHPAPPVARRLPRGGDHLVLVIPAFLTGDWATASFRRFLRGCDLRAEGWGLGVNWGPTPRILAGLQGRLGELRAIEQGPISLIGISLGGLLARDLAHDRPTDVRQVITMASPWRLPTASTIEPLVHLTAPFHSRDIDLVRLARPLPVPATSLYTRDDGVVAWRSCFAAGSEETIEVRGAHVTICRNPQAMAAVVERLAGGGQAPR